MPKLKQKIAIGTIGYSSLIQLKKLPHIVALLLVDFVYLIEILLIHLEKK
jgi:hypothetical protein